MNLYTRCSKCETTFRVTTQQLQSSGGQVRCGNCKNIFDAFATLTAQEPLSSAPEPAALMILPQAQESSVDPNALPAVAPARDPATDRPQLAEVDPAAGLYEWEFRMPEPPRHVALWSMLAFVVALLLVLQVAYAFRTEITVLLPQARGYYIQFCESAGCVIRLPGLPNYLHIAASDLKSLDSAHPNEIQLSLSVRNRAPVDLAYPAFELTLTDSDEQTIARRVFLPADYVPTISQSAGLKAGTEMPIQLFLDTGPMRAAGYRLYLFYP